MQTGRLSLLACLSLSLPLGCASDSAETESSLEGTGPSTGDESSTSSGDATGDGGTDVTSDGGDGDASTGSSAGDGDDAGTGGDADASATAGDGDGSSSGGDGDGDTSTDSSTGGGDGDGDSEQECFDACTAASQSCYDACEVELQDCIDACGNQGCINMCNNDQSCEDVCDAELYDCSLPCVETGGGDGDECEAPAQHNVCDAPGDNPTWTQAIGLDCPGEAFQMTPTLSNTMHSADASAWAIARQFGSSGDWTQQEGEQMLLISTKTLSAPSNQGVITQSNGYYIGNLGNPGQGDNGNPNGAQLPGNMNPVDGGQNGPFLNCDGINDCSNSLQDQWSAGGDEANDLLWAEFTVEVPVGTYGWNMDFNFITAEYPTYVDTTFNDIFVVWNQSEAYVGNTCFVNGEPCTVTALAAAFGSATGAGPTDPQMAGTGMQPTGQTPEGGATGWYEIQGLAQPGETLDISFAVFDMGDTDWDTVVLLDNWRWNCEGCDPTIPDDCAVIPIPE